MVASLVCAVVIAAVLALLLGRYLDHVIGRLLKARPRRLSVLTGPGTSKDPGIAHSVDRAIATPAHTRVQFSLLTLVATLTVTAVWLGLLRWIPHVTVFATATGVLAFSIVVLVRSHRRGCSIVKKLGCWLLTAASTAVFYAASIGPVVGLKYALGYGDGLVPGTSILGTFYAPVLWLLDVPFLEWPLVEYARAWGL